MTTFLRLLGFLKPYKGGVFWSVGLAATAMATGALIPVFIGNGIGQLQDGDRSQLLWFALAIVAAGLARAILSVLRRIVSGRVSLGVEHDMRRGVYGHLQELEVAFFQGQQTGQLMSRATVDLNVVRFFLGYGLVFLIQSAFTILVAGAIMLWIEPGLAALVLAPTPLIVYSAARYGREARPALQAVQQRIAELSATAEENISGIRVIKAFAREAMRLNVFTDSVQRVFDQQMRSTRLRAFYNPLLAFIPSMGLAAVLLVGGRRVIDGSLPLSEFVTFFFYVQMLVVPMRTFGNSLGSAQRATAAGARIFELLDREPRVEAAPDARPLPPGGGEVVFDHVGFSYAGNTRAALEDVSFTVPAGKTVALVGGTGSGKTTLVSLVPRLYDPTDGRITVDGLDVQQADPFSLRSQIAFVAEDSFLFSASIAENIAYARDDVTDAEIEQAARRAQIADFIETLPDRYDTVVGERGITLSGGQRQRVAIARALLADPRILILDDATSSVDARTESEIKEALREVMRDRTTFVIAHRLSTISLADFIVVLENGGVSAIGTHEELMESSDSYRTLATKGMPESVFLTRKDPALAAEASGL